MAKKITLSKTSLLKINSFIKAVNEHCDEEFCEGFRTSFEETLTKELRHQHKECAEKYIVEFFITAALNKIKEQDYNFDYDDEFYEVVKKKARQSLVSKYASNKHFDNNIDIYFNDVKKEYIMHPVSEQDELEVLPENKEIFIKNNLKLAIECAKRYTGLGLPFEDLIQIGNVGLLTAFEKYDKDRAKLRVSIINDINDNERDDFTAIEAEAIIRKNFVYSKNLDETLDSLPEDGFESKDEFIKWVKKNVKTAVFASVAFMWIRAYIIMELNTLGKTIRVPKTKEEGGNPISFINLDSLNPHTEDNYNDNAMAEITNEEFLIEEANIEIEDKNNTFKQILSSALNKLGLLERRIIQKRYGIGMPYELSINEIAESEGISVNRVKYLIASSLKTIGNNINAADKEVIKSLLR